MCLIECIIAKIKHTYLFKQMSINRHRNSKKAISISSSSFFSEVEKIKQSHTFIESLFCTRRKTSNATCFLAVLSIYICLHELMVSHVHDSCRIRYRLLKGEEEEEENLGSKINWVLLTIISSFFRWYWLLTFQDLCRL